MVPLRDEDQPFIYDIRFSKKKFTLELYDTANPNQHWSSLQPDVVVLAYDISNRATLDGLKAVWFISITSCGQADLELELLVAKRHHSVLPVWPW